MLSRDTDTHWEYWGKTDPYWGVLTADEFRRENLDEAALARFFESGRNHIDRVLDTVRRCLDPGYRPRRALDFGCGVGRLLIPLAAHCEEVVGVDVSPSMLGEADRNCRARNLANVSLVESDDKLSRVTGKFDLVHSMIVFQHIPVSRGERLFRCLLERLEVGGVGAVHFSFHKRISSGLRARIWLYDHIPLVVGIRNLLKGDPLGAPVMQMNEYDLGRLLSLLQDAGCSECHLQLIPDGLDETVLLLFQRRRDGGKACGPQSVTRA